MWNLYGQAETNICAAMLVPQEIPEDNTAAFAIGRVCHPARARVVDDEGRDVPPGTFGELVIAGPGVTAGYFGQPELTARAFLPFNGAAGPELRWYRTGDLVTDDGTGSYVLHGRCDRMVGERADRVELNEIEAALQEHEGVERASVVSKTDGSGASVAAFIAMKPGFKGSLIAMKRHCLRRLPRFMIPDTITFVSGLPTTSRDELNNQRLESREAAIRRT
jgi:acyl-CoA synthetase (AMP-forming)/AMP-acid ligase II